MGLGLDAVKLLLPHLKNAKILSLGYPDLLIEDPRSVFGVTPKHYTEFGPWHGVQYPLPETVETFALLGSTLKCIDIHASRGCEEIIDLNYLTNLGKFDLVIDAGTIEHCFNIGHAILNASNAVKAGGHIFHSPPMTMLNHGFYNVCPTLLFDFYYQNGWEIEHLTSNYGAVPYVKRFKAAPECCLYFIAKRIGNAWLKYPTQSKYINNKDLK
jgi:hypothetical protein